MSVNLLVFPLDTLKTRLQSPHFHQLYRSASATAQRTLWRNLYQGVGTVALVAVPSSGVFFTTYEGLKAALGSSSSASSPNAFLPQPAVHALSSSIAQLVNCAIVTPAEVLKQNAQMLGAVAPLPRGGGGGGRKQKVSLPSSSSSASPTLRVLQQMKRHPRKLWRGYTAMAARDLPFTALQFPALEYLREVLMERRSRLRKHGEPVTGVFERAWISAVSAGVAGSAAAWVTTPFDVVKTRMMLEAGMEESAGVGRRRKSGFQVGREVFQKEGMRGLFRGGFVRAAFTILGNGLYIGCYEGAKMYLQEEEERR
jgi:solute carrier family 25 S-adenosylmethionine transporter 26